MDSTKKLPDITQSPAYLVIGPAQDTATYAQTLISHVFCKDAICGKCTNCKAIRAQQYYALHWLKPEKNYTRESIASIFSTMSLALESQQHFFFVLEDAELLTTSAANSLLKAIEEPPPGYHFIFLTQRLHDILPTIVSRCISISSNSVTHHINHAELYDWLTTHYQVVNPLAFTQTIEEAKITESQSIQLLDTILAYWIQEYIASPQYEKKIQCKKIIDILQHSYEYLPMPGSSSLFWKNIWMQITSQ